MSIRFRPFVALARAGLAALAIATAAPAMAQQVPDALNQKFEPSHVAAANEVLKASGLRTMFENTLPNVIGGIRANVTRTRPELTKDIEESLKIVEARIPQFYDDGVVAASRFLAVRLTEAELKEIGTFLVSPAGKKYVEVLPGFMEQVIPFLELWNQEVAQKMTVEFQQEMAKRGHKL